MNQLNKLLLHLCLLISPEIYSQTLSDGPIDLKIRVRDVNITATVSDAPLLGASFAPDDYSIKIWARDDSDEDGVSWQGGTLYQEDFTPPGLTADFNDTIFEHSYTGASAPQFFDLKLEAWEDDLPTDNLGSFCNSGSRGAYNSAQCCGVIILGTCVGITTGDDNYCDADNFKSGMDYRQGPPCQWYDHGYVSGSCPSNNFYQPKIESYWRYTDGTSTANTIDLGSFLPLNSISHYNSNECYSNTHASSPGNDVSYSFTLSDSLGIKINTFGATFNTQLYLLDNSLTQIATDNGSGNDSEIIDCTLGAGTYYVVVDGAGAADMGLFTLEISLKPSGIEVNSSLSEVCLGDSVQLIANIIGTCDTITTVPCNGPSTVYTRGISEGNNNSSSPHWVTFFGNRSRRVQYIITKEELNELGFHGSNIITALDLNYHSVNTTPINGLTLNIGCTTDDAFSPIGNTSTTLNGINFKNPSAYKRVLNSGNIPSTIVTGWNTFTFDYPYLWDGQSNILIELCTDQFNSSGTPANINYETTGTELKAIHAQSTSTAGCAIVTGTAINTRPIMRFNACAYNPNGYTFNWSPSTSINNSTAQNPIATPNTNTTYEVTVSDGTCSIRESIPLSLNTLQAAFVLNPPVGCAIPHTVFFTDQSTLPDTWAWNFGDGNTSTLQNPVHSYTATGTYVVTLTVTDTIVGCSDVATDTVHVSIPTADFNGNGSPSAFGCAPLTVNFSDLSTPTGASIVSWAWNFGDGGTSSLQNPSYVYQKPGVYTVSLQTTDQNGCTHTKTRLAFAQAIGPDVNFGPAIVTPSQPPLTVNFTDSTIFSAPIVSWQWNFGDGNTSNLQNPANTFTTVDTFDVSLTVIDIDGCTRTFSRTDLVITDVLDFNLNIDSHVSCNGFSDGGVTATAISGTPPYTYSWSNGGTSSSITNLIAGTYTATITDASGATKVDMGTITEPTAIITSSIVDNNASCNGLSDGGATTSATGGIMPYTYLWSNSATTASITGVVAGTYTATVTDANGCTSTSSSTITEPALLAAASVADSNVSCNGLSDGGATASATGGTMPYTYLWSNSATTASITGVTAGTYTVSITDANGCGPATSTTTITEPTVLVSASVVDSNVTCNGLSDGGATASASGGTMPYTYAWSNSATTPAITGVTAGTYSVTITDANGCTDSSSSTITEPTLLVSASVVDSNVSCNGFSDGGATASATGGTGAYTYLWSNSATTASITGVVAGTYSVTITDANGCTDSSSSTITEPAVLAAASVVDSNVSCNGFSDGGATAAATGGTMPYTYAWSNSATTASITGVVAGTYSVTITDANGCTDSSSSTVTEPAVLAAASVVDSNVSCNGLSDGGATASSTGGTMPYTYLWSNSATSASITGVVAGTYTVSITDANGCGPATSTVTITEPTVLVSSAVVDSNVTCNGFSDGGATASATGGTMPYTYSWSNTASTTSITGVVANTYSVTVTDANGCTDSSSVVITEPALLVSSTVVDSNVSCNGLSDGGATTSSTGGTMPYTYLWSNSATSASITGVVAGTYSVTVTDANGCTDSSSVVITQPALLVASAAVDSNATCLGVTDGGATASGVGGTMPYTYLWSNSATTQSITGIANGTYSVTITDMNGCTDSASVTITVVDTIKPTVTTQNVTVYLDASGSASITTTDIDNGSMDACGISMMSLDVTSFACVDTGSNVVYLRVTDVNGNIDSATATVTVLDTINPTVLTQNVTVYLDASGSASITTNDVDNGSGGACGIASTSLDATNFNCSEIGANTVTLVVTDVNGNIDSTTAIVTVLDTIKPIVLTQNVTVYLDTNGEASITTMDINNGSSDNCSIMNMSLDSTNFECSEVGVNTVTLSVTDVNTNVGTATAIVSVLDTISPTVLTQDVTVYLDANGQASITTMDINNGSSDNCSLMNMSLDSTNFDCSEVGANTITLTVNDVNTNTSSATATATVMDTISPTVMTQNVTVYLDASGSASITTTDIDNGSMDACGISMMSLDVTSFACVDTGSNVVYLRVTDVNGNIDSATATVTVMDTISPTVITQNVTVYLDANGSANITTGDIDNGSSDNCSLMNMSLDSTNFDCSEVGVNTVTLSVTDVNTNIGIGNATVTVLDTISPTVITQNATVYLDTNGEASITTMDINNGSSDNCSIMNMSLDSTNFDCLETGMNTVTLTVNDVNSNSNTSTAMVIVLDTIHPSISNCPANIVMSMDPGNCSAVVNWVLPTTSDNCGVDSLVSNFNSGDTFSIGITEVIYVAYDASLNTDTCRFTITVTDDENPSFVVFPNDITVNNDPGNCSAVVNWVSPISIDNCGIDSVRSNFNRMDVFPVGTTTVTYIVYDPSQNTDTASFTVTVIDNEMPFINCPSSISQCDSLVSFLDATANDNCSIAALSRTDAIGLNSGDIFPVGITTLEYQATDGSGNQASCSFDIEVYQPAIANAGPDLITTDIDPIPMQSSVFNATTINWVPFMSLDDPSSATPIANPQTTTTYVLSVISPDGCMDTDSVEVMVNIVNEIEATNTFTPNGDGRNDVWTVNKPSLIQGCRLAIFNRNGTKVFETNGYNNDWDGRFAGTDLPEATYYYIIDCPDGREYKGPITIVRLKK